MKEGVATRVHPFAREPKRTSALHAWPPEEPCPCRRQDIGASRDLWYTWSLDSIKIEGGGLQCGVGREGISQGGLGGISEGFI